ncbi:MAG: hypothetical protein KJ936_00215 [Proteobacteria bacterium]|nr:hypothetical protein [Pseudomonadota bacterium]MBU2226091.1 hypothetical protein [Pseudomonadota bacterium]
MKKMLSAIVIFFLLLIPAAGDASFLIRLKNGGQLATPMYWIEGRLIFFYYAGGIAGIERIVVDRVERSEKKPADYMDTTSENRGKKELPPLSSITEKAQGPEKTTEIKEEGAEKVNIEAYKNKKDQMTVILDGLLEKQREAAARGDNDAKEKAREEMVKASKEIYKLTDEVTEKNKGKLPEGWWAR